MKLSTILLPIAVFATPEGGAGASQYGPSGRPVQECRDLISKAQEYVKQYKKYVQLIRTLKAGALYEEMRESDCMSNGTPRNFDDWDAVRDYGNHAGVMNSIMWEIRQVDFPDSWNEFLE